MNGNRNDSSTFGADAAADGNAAAAVAATADQSSIGTGTRKLSTRSPATAWQRGVASATGFAAIPAFGAPLIAMNGFDPLGAALLGVAGAIALAFGGGFGMSKLIERADRRKAEVSAV